MPPEAPPPPPGMFTVTSAPDAVAVTPAPVKFIDPTAAVICVPSSEIGMVAAAVGVAHVPSPRQNVVDDADVPELRFATGRLPVTPVDNGKPVAFVNVPELGVPKAPPLTTKAPADPVFTPNAVTTPVPVVTVLGAAPAPPPTISAFAVNALELAQVVPLEK